MKRPLFTPAFTVAWLVDRQGAVAGRVLRFPQPHFKRVSQGEVIRRSSR